MICARLESDPTSPFVRVLWSASPPGQANAQPLENRKRARINRIARISETDRSRNPMLGAACVDGLELLGQFVQVAGIHGHVVAGVIADLKSVPMQFGNLFPGHVILLVGEERKAF